jgi:Glycosyl hydrolases family 39
MKGLAIGLWLAGLLTGGTTAQPRVGPGAGAWEMTKDITEYALWRLPSGAVPADARFVEMEVRFPEGTLFSAFAREAEPRSKAWTLAGGYTVFGTRWQRLVLPLGTFPGKRVWMPKSDEPLLVFPASECRDRTIPPGEMRFVGGDNRLALDRIRSLEFEFPATNGWAGPARRGTYAVRGIRYLARSPREDTLAKERVAIAVDCERRLGPIRPIWGDACHTSRSFQQLGQRMYKVFGAATFGPFYAPQKGPEGRFNWFGVDAQVKEAQRSAPVIQIVIGRDVPPWLWQSGGSADAAGPGAGPWKLGQLLPPRDYAAYENVVYSLAKHIRDDLGCRVHSYLVWGGADSTGYFRGTMDDYCRIYAACARAIGRADPEAEVGGPSPDPLFNPDWVRALIRHCGESGVPLDFVSLHNYSLYADQSRLAAEWTRRELGRYPSLRDTEIHFDEWNSGLAFGPVHADFKRSTANAAYAAATFGEMTEGGVAYACYAAPSEGWGFFGVRLEEDDGTPRPIGNAFRLFTRLEGERCAAEVRPGGTGIGALAAREGSTTRVALWGYSPEDQPSSSPLTAQVDLSLTGLGGAPGPRTVRLWCIDSAHSNLAAGKEHAALEPLPDRQVTVTDGKAVLPLTLEVPSVWLVEM